MSLVYTSLCFAQSPINIGFRSELGITNISINGKSEVNPWLIPIQNLSLIVNVKLDENNSIEMFPSYILTRNNYEGWEVGIDWKYLLTNNVYTSLGYYFHFNKNNAGGNSGGTGKTISLMFLKVGYQLTELLSFELSYHNPLEKNYGKFLYKDEHYDHNLNSIIKFGAYIKINK